MPTRPLMRAVICLLAFVALSAVEPTAKSITVVNGDFESGTLGWENNPQLSAKQRHAGVKSLALTKGFVFQSLGTSIPVEPGGDYRLKLWVKTSECEANGAGICAMFRGPGGNDIVGGWVEGSKPVYIMDRGQSPVLAAFGGTQDWSESIVTIPATQIPVGAAKLVLYLRHDLDPHPTGTVFFDDISVEQLPSGTVSAGTIIKNGGFELGKAGWWGNGTWSIDQTGAADGVSALKIESGYVCQDKRPVNGGQRYRVTMQVRCTDAPEGSVYVQSSYRGPGVDPTWYGPVTMNGETSLLATGGTQTWKPYSVVVEAPTGATEILLYLRKADGSAGTA